MLTAILQACDIFCRFFILAFFMREGVELALTAAAKAAIADANAYVWWAASAGGVLIFVMAAATMAYLVMTA